MRTISEIHDMIQHLDCRAGNDGQIANILEAINERLAMLEQSDNVLEQRINEVNYKAGL